MFVESWISNAEMGKMSGKLQK